MWRTSIGERTLRGKEWDLFREGLSMLWDRITMSRRDPHLCMTGVGVFDDLQPASRLAMLALVGKALHDEAEPCPDLTALTEGTFAAVYAVIRDQIDVEIESGREDPSSYGDDSSLRALVLATFHEVSPEWHDSLPSPDCEDVDHWTILLNVLMDRVLWDRDFEDEELFLDTDPGVGDPLKKKLGIAGGYFTAIAPEPTGAQLASIRETLRRLCERPKRRGRSELGDGRANPWF
jgi:hypothetical protein